MAIKRYVHIGVKGTAVPGGSLIDVRKNDMNPPTMLLANPASGRVGGVGTGSGRIDGGNLGKGAKGKAT